MEQIRKETAQSIENLRQELQTDVLSMENNIAEAVIKALKNPSAISMETENYVKMSSQSTAYETTTTMKTLEEKFDSLSTMVKMLAERLSEIVENQEANQHKRNRPEEYPMKQILKMPSTRQSAQGDEPTAAQHTASSWDPSLGRDPGGKIMSNKDSHPQIRT
jgi:hypothetical protein